MVLELVGLFDADDGQPGRVKHTDLDEDRSLIPINPLAGDLIALELHDDHKWNFDLAMGGPNPRKHPIHLDVMGERKNEFIHQPIVPYRPGEETESGIGRHPGNEMLPVKLDHLVTAPAPGPSVASA